MSTRRSTRIRRAIEQEYNRPLPDVLRDMLYRRRMTQKQVAEKLGVAQTTVSYWDRMYRGDGDAKVQPAESVA